MLATPMTLMIIQMMREVLREKRISDNANSRIYTNSRMAKRSNYS